MGSTLDQRIERVRTSATSSSSVLPVIDDSARALLRQPLLSDHAAVLATAARFSAGAGRPAVDLEVLRLSCAAHQLLQPPIRPRQVKKPTSSARYTQSKAPH